METVGCGRANRILFDNGRWASVCANTLAIEGAGPLIELTPEELANGWTAESLAAYRRERDKEANVTAGNVVTEFKRPKDRVKIIGSGLKAYNPHSW